MTPTTRAAITVDAGSATTAVALVAEVGTRWRLLGALAAPAGADERQLVERLLVEVASADPELAESTGIRAGRADDLPRWRVASAPPRTLAVLAGSPRAAALAERVACGTGWRIALADPESHDPREVTALLLRRDVAAAFVFAGDPPGADERASLGDLAALVAAVRVRRPDLPIVLAGAMAAHRRRFDRLGLDAEPGASVLGLPTVRGTDPVAAARMVLEDLRAPGGDARTALATATAALAAALGRRVELLEIGHDGGIRVRAEPAIGDRPARLEWTATADGALVPPTPGDDVVERIAGWLGRDDELGRLADRIHELRSSPWAGSGVEPARLRLAAATAALERLLARTPALSDGPGPDLVVIAGGGFALAPGPAVAVALADVLRRPGAVAIAMDHARLLGPLGAVGGTDDRQAIMTGIHDDLLSPLGTLLVLPDPGVGRRLGPAGRVELRGTDVELDLDVGSGTVELVDLPSGAAAAATVTVSSGGWLGRSARRIAVPVSGGLAGLVVDGRGVPLRLPGRRDERDATRASWHDPLWPSGHG